MYALLGAWIVASLVGQALSASTSGLAIAYTYPCDVGQRFDATSLTCSECPTGFLPSTDQLHCVYCDTSAGTDSVYSNGYVGTSTWTAGLVSATSGTCSCAAAANASSVSAVVTEAGRYYQRCITCPSNTLADAAAGQCIVPPATQPATPQADLAYVVAALNRDQGAGINLVTATQATIQSVQEPSGNAPAYVIPQSQPLAQLLGPAARACMDARSPEGCNAVANLCALQLFDTRAASCQMYAALVTRLAGGASSASSPRPATGPLPWLYYTRPGVDYLQAEDFTLGVSVAPETPPLAFVLSTYDINGTWLGLANWTLQLQACGGDAAAASLWPRFGTAYNSECGVSLLDLLARADASPAGPRFYEPFLALPNGDLYPLPVKVTNKAENGRTPAAEAKVGHVRRFFFIDSALGRSGGGARTAAAGAADAAGATQAVQYPSALRVEVTLRSDAPPRTHPPLITITYGALQSAPAATAHRAATARASFTASYVNSVALVSQFWQAWRITLLVVLLLVSLYWLVTVRLAQAVAPLMLPDEDMAPFGLCVGLALVGQTLGLVHMMVQQLSVDVFFIDWEKPRKVVAKGATTEEAAPVSCWRTLLVANEWNELQAARLTFPHLTLVAVVFLMDGLHLSAAASLHAGPPGLAQLHNVLTSMVLRFAVAAALTAVLVLGQVLYLWLVGHRAAPHPLGQYEDLLFLANTSALVLDARTTGFYLHGRNRMAHADASLRELNAALLQEEQGLVGGRGLVGSYVSHPDLNNSQAFFVALPLDVRRRFEATLLAQVEQAAQEQRANRGVVTSAMRGPQRPRAAAVAARDELAAMFRGIVDEAERQHTTQVLVPTFWQSLLRLAPVRAAGSRAVFMHDTHHSWARVLFPGQELRLCVWSGLLFSGLTMWMGSAAAAAFVTYLALAALRGLRSHFGRSNLSRKTLVDSHFLI